MLLVSKGKINPILQSRQLIINSASDYLHKAKPTSLWGGILGLQRDNKGCKMNTFFWSVFQPYLQFI